jgi:hypothetical protein
MFDAALKKKHHSLKKKGAGDDHSCPSFIRSSKPSFGDPSHGVDCFVDFQYFEA